MIQAKVFDMREPSSAVRAKWKRGSRRTGRLRIKRGAAATFVVETALDNPFLRLAISGFRRLCVEVARERRVRLHASAGLEALGVEQEAEIVICARALLQKLDGLKRVGLFAAFASDVKHREIAERMVEAKFCRARVKTKGFLGIARCAVALIVTSRQQIHSTRVSAFHRFEQQFDGFL